MLNTSTMQCSHSHGDFLDAEHKGMWVISLIDPKCPDIFRELILWCSVFREELKQVRVCVLCVCMWTFAQVKKKNGCSEIHD